MLANVRQLQQDFHAHHIRGVTHVMDATVRELRARFLTENLPISNALTETTLNCITSDGLSTSALVIFLQNLGIIKDTMLCPEQRYIEPARMVLYSGSEWSTVVVSWRCCHNIEGRHCRKIQSSYKGKFFDGCNVPIRDKFLVILKLLNQHTHSEIMNEISIYHETISNWKNQCRHYFRMYGKIMHRIGGPGTIVEID